MQPGRGADPCLDRLKTLPVGRRARWVVIALWVAAALGLGWLQPRLQAATENDPAAFLPAGAESTRVLELLGERFRGGGTTPALLVGAPEQVRQDAPAGARVVSGRDDTAYAVVPLEGRTAEELAPRIDELRAGSDALVTGPAALIVDGVEIFESIDLTLLLATSALILVLLISIYRSPLVALVPLVVVALAYAVAAGLVYVLVTQAGMQINGQATGLLIVLMFGAGTDYCLLIVARYREELRREEDATRAMATTVRSTTPAILSSGSTVVAAMLVLLVADLSSTRTSGPVLALGIAVTMLAGLTLLPALLLVLGRRSFWPSAPRAGEDPGRGHRLWERLGGIVRRRPVAVLLVTTPLVLGTLGNLIDLPGLSFGQGFRNEPESTRGLERLTRGFSAGTLAPTDVVVPAGRAARAQEVVASVSGVGDVRPVGRSAEGGLARLQATLTSNPYRDEAVATVERLRDRLDAAGLDDALVGGPTAEEADTRATVTRDFALIAPLALGVIFLILVALLRAVVAPAFLVASQVLTFYAALGISYAAFAWVFDAPGSDASLPTFVFIFVVALGIDYTIFLMARVREEATRTGHEEGVVRGLVATGGVITSAGLILAGTFLVLMLLPLEQLFQLGFAIALGVFLDTFVVRTLVVPALALVLGRATWWPGGPGRLLGAAPARGR